ncbi:hypothetical protein [Sporosarcina sp. P10]|uniref:hypothetical protein n=1 Tax=unclassified Sporosarcina TaxID=2647733 RepID=UPI0026A5F7A0
MMGGDPGGYTAAIRAAQLGHHVTLIEKNQLRWCMPQQRMHQKIFPVLPEKIF